MSLTLPDLWQHLQRQLFPALTEEVGPLSRLDEQFVQTISRTDLSPFLRRYQWIGNGCPPHARVWLIHAFLAKSVYQFPTTAALLDALRTRPTLRQLCGWESVGDLPSESTFARAFAAFADDAVPQQIHERMVCTHAGPKLAGQVSRDATAIEAPEGPAPKPIPTAVVPRPRGRPRAGEIRPPAPPKRMDLQPERTLAENPGRPAQRLQRGLQAQQPGPSRKLDRLQAALGHR